MIHTYNEYHLGDQLIHLNFLRRLCAQDPSLEFTHHCNPQYHNQIKPLAESMPIRLGDLNIPSGAINSWIGSENYFFNHPKRLNWAEFHLDWFSHLSRKIGILNPLTKMRDLLFDYPALRKEVFPEFDYLIINAPPQSGQVRNFNPDYFIKRVAILIEDGMSVITTHPTGLCPNTIDVGLDVSAIGNLSLFCRHIESIDTGPMWPTMNLFNQDKILTRIIYGKTHITFNHSKNVIVKAEL